MEKPRKYLYLVYVLGPFQNSFLEDELKDTLGLDIKSSYDKYFYCWTTKKKLLKKFMKYRDKKRFIIKKINISHISDDEWDAFKSSNFISRINEPTNVSTITSRIKGCPKTETGMVDFRFTLVNFEDSYILNTEEWFEQKILDDFSDSSLVILSILVMCAAEELRIAMYNSGIIGLMSYISLLRTGDDLSGEDNGFFLPEVDELAVLLNFYGELFKF